MRLGFKDWMFFSRSRSVNSKINLVTLFAQNTGEGPLDLSSASRVQIIDHALFPGLFDQYADEPTFKLF